MNIRNVPLPPPDGLPPRGLPFSLLFSLVLLIAACSSSGPTHVAVDPFEQNAVNALSIDDRDQAAIALAAALKRYRALDDLEGQWRIHHLRARMALADHDRVAAQRESAALSRLAALLGTRHSRFHSALIAGRVTGSAAAFESALAVAASPGERAVAMTYLGDTAAAVDLVDGEAVDPADLAFIYYRHATAIDSPEYFETALSYYRMTGNSRGVADALFALARLARRSGDSDRSRTYGERAAQVLRASGDDRRADYVDAWLGAP